MKRTKLTAKSKRLIRQAAPDEIVDFLVSVPNSSRGRKWLRKTNQFRVNCVRRYEAADVRGLTPKDQEHLLEYISASAPTHVIDGWGFVSRAMEASLSGNIYAALHLAYYAELRGAMGLLAGEAIGIFSGIHAVVSKGGAIGRLPVRNRPKDRSAVGTHKVVWPALDVWSRAPRAQELIDVAVAPDDVPLSDWLSVGTLSVSPRVIARNWLTTWGLELRAIGEDHDLRNVASYRPSEFQLPAAVDVDKTLDFLTLVWTSLEPSGSGRFLELERQLLQAAWSSQARPNVTIAQLERIGVDRGRAHTWQAMLGGGGLSELVRYAQQTSAIDGDHPHLNVIARSVLLLFLATMRVRSLLRAAGYSREDLQFWWHRHGIERGWWAAGAEPEDPRDLWQDVRDALDTVQSILKPQVGSGQYGLRVNGAGVQSWLVGFDLPAMWSLVP